MRAPAFGSSEGFSTLWAGFLMRSGEGPHLQASALFYASPLSDVQTQSHTFLWFRNSQNSHGLATVIGAFPLATHPRAVPSSPLSSVTFFCMALSEWL